MYVPEIRSQFYIRDLPCLSSFGVFYVVDPGFYVWYSGIGGLDLVQGTGCLSVFTDYLAQFYLQFFTTFLFDLSDLIRSDLWALLYRILLYRIRPFCTSRIR